MDETIDVDDSYGDRIRRNIAKFRHYRHGREFRRSARDLWENLTVPQRWSGEMEDVIMTNSVEPQYQEYYRRTRQKDQRLEEVEHERDLRNIKYRRAWRVFRSMSEEFDWGPTYRRGGALGWGGNGLVVRYDTHDPDNNITKSIAVKRALNDEAKWEFEEEEEMMLNFVGAEHLINIIPKPKSPYEDVERLMNEAVGEAIEALTGKKRDREDDDEDYDAPYKRAKLEIDAPGMVVMEYMPNGDLADFISRIAERNGKVPNRIMWRLFLCLVRACLEMRYPPSDRRDDKSREQHLVHFDFDPKNIFIDELVESPEHEINPRLKVGDFGLADFFQEGEHKDYSHYQFYRWRGKPGFFAPEQFTKEWEFIEPFNNDFPHPVAGNYSTHTNVWGIGCVMQCILTLSYPPTPPQVTEGLDEDDLPFPTYGGHLDRQTWENADEELVAILDQCLAHNPNQRPTLQELAKYIPKHEAKAPKEDLETYEGPKPGLQGTDAQLSAWVREILFDAPECF